MNKKDNNSNVKTKKIDAPVAKNVSKDKPQTKTAPKKKTEESAEKLSQLKRVSLNVVENSMRPSELATKIAGFLEEKKALDIAIIDLSGKTIIADYFVIASARSTTAVRALTEFIDEKLSKGYEIEPLRRDMDAKWCAIDYGSVILHIFHEETREFYQLERLWTDGENLKYVTPSKNPS